MRRRVKCCTLLRIHFSTANQKIQIYFRYQSYTRRNLKKKPWSSGDENENMLHSFIVTTTHYYYYYYYYYYCYYYYYFYYYYYQKTIFQPGQCSFLLSLFRSQKMLLTLFDVESNSQN